MIIIIVMIIHPYRNSRTDTFSDVKKKKNKKHVVRNFFPAFRNRCGFRLPRTRSPPRERVQVVVYRAHVRISR